MIKKIIITESGDNHVFEIGQDEIAKFYEEIHEVAENQKASFYVAYNNNGNKVLQINKANPFIIPIYEQ